MVVEELDCSTVQIFGTNGLCEEGRKLVVVVVVVMMHELMRTTGTNDGNDVCWDGFSSGRKMKSEKNTHI